MKPKIVQLYETSTGTAVKTLAEWKHSEITNLFKIDTEATPDSAKHAKTIIDNSDEIIAILSVPEKIGRPNGAKDKKPRKKVALTPTIQHSETAA